MHCTGLISVGLSWKTEQNILHQEQASFSLVWGQGLRAYYLLMAWLSQTKASQVPEGGEST